MAPAPEREMVAGELLALLATATLPVKLPAAEGVNVTSSVALCPGVNVKPAEIPLAVNLAPDTLTLETVTLEFPALLSFTLSVLPAPTATFPKLTLEAFASSSAAGATPVPLTVTVLGADEAVLITDTSPVTTPLAFGRNTTNKADCFPGAMVMGRVAPEIANPLAVVLAWVTVSAVPPEFEMVTDCCTVPPTATEPN